MDIRRYFGGSTNSQSVAKNDSSRGKRKITNDDSKSKPQKRKRLLPILMSDSDDDDVVKSPISKKKSPIKQNSPIKSRLSLKRKPSQVNISPVKQNHITVADFFGKAPVRRIQKKVPEEIELHDDSDFEETLRQLDEQSTDITKTPEKSIRSSPRSSTKGIPKLSVNGLNYEESKSSAEPSNSNVKINRSSPVKTPIKMNSEVTAPVRSSPRRRLIKAENNTVKENLRVSPRKRISQDEIVTSETSKISKITLKKSSRKFSPEKETPQKSTSKKVTPQKLTPKAPTPIKKTPTSVKKSSEKLTPETTPTTKFSPKERTSSQNISYRNYLNRAGPRAPGSKQIPEGEEDCLKGLTFVITGVMESLERDEIADLIKKYGGKVTQSLSKNTSFIIIGSDAGPSKLEKAEKLGTKQMNEDDLLEMIGTRKGKSRGSAKLSGTSVIKRERENVKSKLPELSVKRKSPQKNEKAVNAIAKVKASVVSLGAEDGVAMSSRLWVDKYKPMSTKQIIGQHGDRSNAKKLANWLMNWHSKNTDDNKTSKKASDRWGRAADDGSGFKAALLSGPPGVGKTTTATIVCKEAGFTFVEFNASDTRSKRNLQEVVSEMLMSRSLSMCPTERTSKNHCLIMDEVDGMAGNEDRGGIQEMIQLIKRSKIPVICICNDRNHTKIRSLANYCFDLRFMKPRVENIKAAMMSICYKENLKIPPQALHEIIVGAQHDVRQIINHLFLWSSTDKNLSEANAKREAQKAKKDIKLNPFDTLRRVFSADDHKTMSIHDKSDLFFFDYSLAPLFVQENYLSMNPASAIGNKKKILRIMSETAESICHGDLVDQTIRKNNSWNLLPVEALYASVIPGNLLACNVPGQIAFPSWLGNNSRRNKMARIAKDLLNHMHLRVSSNTVGLGLDYLPYLRDSIAIPLKKLETEGVPTAVSIMESYDLLREDWDEIIEFTTWPGRNNPANDIQTKVKSAFTRTFNKETHLVPYAVTAAAKKSKGVSNNNNYETEDDLERGSENEEEEESLEADAMVKVKSKIVQQKQKSQGRRKKVS